MERDTDPSARALDGSRSREGVEPGITATIIVLVLGSLYFLIGNLGAVGFIAARVFRELAAGGGAGFDAAVLAESLQGFIAENRLWLLAFQDACQWGIFLAWAYAWTRKSLSRKVAAYARYDAAPAGMIALGVVVALVLIPGLDPISRAIDALLPAYRRLSEASAALYAWTNPAEAAAVVFSISLTPAVCEEFVFRGVYQRSLERSLPFPWHFIVSGAVFALFHQSPLGLLSLIPVGIFLGLLYWASGSIWPGMAFHAAYNGLILILVNETLPLPSWIVSGDYFSWPATAAGAAASIALFFLLVRSGRARSAARPEAQPEESPASASTP